MLKKMSIGSSNKPAAPTRASPTVRVLVATRRTDVHAALEQIAPYALTEAVSTRGVYTGLRGTQLAIVELDALLEEEVPCGTLLQVLQQSPTVVWTTPDGFLREPATWRSHALAASGHFECFPPATAALTSYSGGVGKTTLSLDAAVHFADRTKLPTAVVEFPYGPSALRVITGTTEGAGFVDAVHNDPSTALRSAFPVWRGVTLVTVNYADVSGLLKPEEVAQCFERIRSAHILTIVDSEFPHPWLETVAKQVGTFIIVGAPRPDAWNNAAALQQLMARTPDLYPHSQVVFNLVEGWGDRLTQLGLERRMDLPRVKYPERLEGRLGSMLLKAIYPYWAPTPGAVTRREM